MNPIYDIPPLIGFGLSVLLAFLVIRQHPYSFVHRVFTAFLSAMGFWALVTFGMRTSRTLAEALVWEKVIFATLPVVSVTFLHFALLLTGARQRRLLFFAYAVMVVAVLLSPTDLIVAGMRERWYGHGFINGVLGIPFIVVFYGFVIIALIHLIRARRRAESNVEKNRYSYVALGAALCLFGLLLDIMAASGVRIYPMGLISNILFSLVTSYAMLRFHLLEFHVVVRRGAAYAIVSAAGIGVVIATVSVVYLFGIDAWEQPGWVKVIFITVIAILLQPVLGWTQSRVDKWFYRERYDYLQALEKLSEETRTITDLHFIASSLVDMVASTMKCRSVAVMLPDAEERSFVSVASRGMRNGATLSLNRDGLIVWWLRQHEDFLARSDINVKPQFKELTAASREALETSGADLIAPLVTREGLRGILVLGRKLSDQDYSPEDIRMLRVVTRQMATTLDSARLYDLQMRRYREQALLAKLGTAVSAEFDVKKLYHLFYRELKETVPVEYFGANLVDEKSRSMSTVFAMTTLPGAPADYQFLGELAREANGNQSADPEVRYLPDARSGKTPPDARVEQAGIRSVLRLPLRSKGGTLGSLILASREPNAYNTEDIRLLQQVAVQLAIAIDKSRLYELERKARQELEKQDRERTDLVNALVHEIKTPLTAILASSELLRDELAPDKSTLGALAANLDTAARNLDRRISELMSFARLQTGMTALQLEVVDVSLLAKSVATQIGELLQSRDQTLTLDLAESCSPVTADPDRITQVLLNLLTNASKFSGPSQRIVLRSYTMNGDLVVEVQDSAPVIGPEEMDHMFQPYYRRSRGRGSGGLGLGLFICQKLVNLHGGKIWVEPSNTGNSFKFSLPLARKPGGKS